MTITLVSENEKQFADKKQALTTLAFCHYPVTVKIENENGDNTEVFDSFDSARDFVLNA